MMKPHIELLPKNILKLKVKPTLRYTIYGLGFALIFCVGIFAYQMIGNSENAKAGHKKKFKLSHSKTNHHNLVEAAVEVEFSYNEDSLYIEFMSVDESEIRSAVLNISDVGSDAEKNIQQAKIYTKQIVSTEPKKIFLSVSIKSLSENPVIETTAFVKTKSAEQAQEVSDKFIFDKKNNSVSFYR